MYGGVGKGFLVTQVDRKSRFLRAGLLAKRDASLTKAVICQLLKDVPVKSISLDNGSEFSEFKALEAELHTLVYFAEPHKPWQRGTNENTNGLLCFFFPKGCDFHAVSQEFVDSVVDLINSRPRKCLGWRSPAEVFHNFGVALALLSALSAQPTEGLSVRWQLRTRPKSALVSAFSAQSLRFGSRRTTSLYTREARIKSLPCSVFSFLT